MGDKELGYLAGIIDGCGYIHIRKYTPKAGKPRAGIPVYTLALVISNKDIRLMEWLVTTLGYGYIRKEEKLYRWIITGRRVGDLMEQVLPFLVIKPEQADIARFYVADMELLPGRKHLSEVQMARREAWHRALIVLHQYLTGSS